MIGPLFTISASNIGRAAIEAASRPVPLDDPSTITLAAHPDGGVLIQVRAPGGFCRDVPVEETAVREVLSIEDSQTCRAACEELIEDRAARVRRAIMESESSRRR